MTHTFRGYIHHTPALSIMHFISPFKGLSNNMCAINLNFDTSKIKQPSYSYVASLWSGAGTCMHVILCFIKHSSPYTFQGIAPTTPPASF